MKLCPITNIERRSFYGTVYDLTVEEDHSYVANNIVVHNSVCKTSTSTGIGQGQVSALLEIQKIYSRAKVIADGGAKEPGDIPKALACGADYVIAGSVFAGAEEAPGSVIKYNGNKYKIYAGEASYLINGSRYVEGVDTLVPYKGPIEKVLQEYEDGLRSSMSYMNCENINGFKGISEDEIILLSENSRAERKPHILGRV